MINNSTAKNVKTTIFPSEGGVRLHLLIASMSRVWRAAKDRALSKELRIKLFSSPLFKF